MAERGYGARFENASAFQQSSFQWYSAQTSTGNFLGQKTRITRRWNRGANDVVCRRIADGARVFRGKRSNVLARIRSYTMHCALACRLQCTRSCIGGRGWRRISRNEHLRQRCNQETTCGRKAAGISFWPWTLAFVDDDLAGARMERAWIRCGSRLVRYDSTAFCAAILLSFHGIIDSYELGRSYLFARIFFTVWVWTRVHDDAHCVNCRRRTCISIDPSIENAIRRCAKRAG